MSDRVIEIPWERALAVEERRLCRRRAVEAPVEVEVEGRVLSGTARDLSYTGVLVEAGGELPGRGAPCRLALRLPDGVVEATGRVARRLEERGMFAVHLGYVHHNSALLRSILAARRPDREAGG